MSPEVFRRPPTPIPIGLGHLPNATFGQRAAESVARFVGSWTFILGQSVLLAVWVTLNVLAYVRHWDPYPFILLNLGLSLQAAYTAPMILMAQNRQAEHDRAVLYGDYILVVRMHQSMGEVLRRLTTIEERLPAPVEGDVPLRSEIPPPPAEEEETLLSETPPAA